MRKSFMRNPLRIRLLVASLILAVFALGTEAVAHSHGLTHDEDHCTCQVCHVGHAAISAPAGQTPVKAPLAEARFAPAEALPISLESSDTVSIPRAPPAFA